MQITSLDIARKYLRDVRRGVGCGWDWANLPKAMTMLGADRALMRNAVTIRKF